MSPCCPKCGSAESVGIEAASICTECATATVAGASVSLPLFVAVVVAAAGAVFVFRMLRRQAGGIIQLKQPAVS